MRANNNKGGEFVKKADNPVVIVNGITPHFLKNVLVLATNCYADNPTDKISKQFRTAE